MERLTLPLPARGVWLRVRRLLGPALERLGAEAGPWKIGGGTVLAARWNHRESIDLDLTVNAGTAMPALFAGPTNDFETKILQRGGSSVRTLAGITLPSSRTKTPESQAGASRNLAK